MGIFTKNDKEYEEFLKSVTPDMKKVKEVFEDVIRVLYEKNDLKPTELTLIYSLIETNRIDHISELSVTNKVNSIAMFPIGIPIGAGHEEEKEATPPEDKKQGHYQ